MSGWLAQTCVSPFLSSNVLDKTAGHHHHLFSAGLVAGGAPDSCDRRHHRLESLTGLRGGQQSRTRQLQETSKHLWTLLVAMPPCAGLSQKTQGGHGLGRSSSHVRTWVETKQHGSVPATGSSMRTIRQCFCNKRIPYKPGQRKARYNNRLVMPRGALQEGYKCSSMESAKKNHHFQLGRRHRRRRLEAGGAMACTSNNTTPEQTKITAEHQSWSPRVPYRCIQ